jgi:hypothetical protein
MLFRDDPQMRQAYDAIHQLIRYPNSPDADLLWKQARAGLDQSVWDKLDAEIAMTNWWEEDDRFEFHIE